MLYSNEKFIDLAYELLPRELALEVNRAFEERCGRAGVHGLLHLWVEESRISPRLAKLLIKFLNETSDSFETEYILAGGLPTCVGELTLEPSRCFEECFSNKSIRDRALIEEKDRKSVLGD